MKEGSTSLGARAQSAIQRAAVLYKPRLATFKNKKRLTHAKIRAEIQFGLKEPFSIRWQLHAPSALTVKSAP
jgi:hypothetical protein